MLQRFGPSALVALLIASTGVAFAITEYLKLQKEPIAKTEVTKLFSPICRCDTARASIAFYLRRRERVSITILASNGTEVRTLLDGAGRPKGELRVTWDGRDNLGRLAPDGNYRIRVKLAIERRTYKQLPNVIRLDTSPPAITLVSATPRTISPDIDGRHDVVHVRFKRSENARVLLYADGRLVGRARLVAKKIDWGGKIAGRVRLGPHRLTLRAMDEAGNLSPPTAPVTVEVRILRLSPTRISTTVGAAFSVSISTDRRQVRWRFSGATGITRRKRLFLRAPSQAGQYLLSVHSGTYGAGALVVVR